ncbi:MAG: hypothetical protein Q8R35_03560 [bacterium]|nr:hypothetical protein [bacterium]
MRTLARRILITLAVIAGIVATAFFISYGSWTLARPGRTPAELPPVLHEVPVRTAALSQAAK